MRDIAAETGVSIATVSRALNGHPSVTTQTRDLVRAAAGRLGAQVPADRGSVFVRCPYVLADYFGTIVSSIAETLELHGRQVILNAGEAAQRRTVLTELAHRTDISGTILILPPESDVELAALRATARSWWWIRAPRRRPTWWPCPPRICPAAGR